MLKKGWWSKLNFLPIYIKSRQCLYIRWHVSCQCHLMVLLNIICHCWSFCLYALECWLHSKSLYSVLTEHLADARIICFCGLFFFFNLFKNTRNVLRAFIYIYQKISIIIIIYHGLLFLDYYNIWCYYIILKLIQDLLFCVLFYMIIILKSTRSPVIRMILISCMSLWDGYFPIREEISQWKMHLVKFHQFYLRYIDVIYND